jgi:hypothetical protein
MENESIKIRAIIEILGAPKEHVQDTMNHILDIVKKNFDVKDAKIHELKEVEKMWSTFVELEILMKKADDLIGFCFDFMPSSIEIIEPQKLNVQTSDLANLFNDLLARLHQYDMAVKNLNAQNRVLKQQIKQK